MTTRLHAKVVLINFRLSQEVSVDTYFVRQNAFKIVRDKFKFN